MNASFNTNARKDIKNLGQVFTPDFIVRQMLSLRKNAGSVLEPSCGNGAFLKHLGGDAVGIEIDNRMRGRHILNVDFFAYSVDNKFDTIVGNPPYVRFQDIKKAPRIN